MGEDDGREGGVVCEDGLLCPVAGVAEVDEHAEAVHFAEDGAAEWGYAATMVRCHGCAAAGGYQSGIGEGVVAVPG